MSELIRMDREYVTRDGRAVRVLCIDRLGDFPVIALANDKDGSEHVSSHTTKGHFYIGCEDDRDLIPKPVKHTRTVWINCYHRFSGITFGAMRDTRKCADESASEDRIACIERTIEFTEGEGL